MKEKAFNLLVIPMKSGLRRRVREFIDGRTIHIDFSEKKDVKKLMKQNAFDAYAIAGELNGLHLTVQELPEHLRHIRKKK